ncbi:MAG: RHS repeat-associated core domain-containing protein [Phycisphaerae bacterium]
MEATPGASYGTVAASYAYDAFGNITSKTGDYADANPFRFSTKYFDAEIGLSYYGYRYYSARLGRWLSRDPIGEAGGVNLYGFVSNAAVNFFDALGLEGEDWNGLLLNGVAGCSTDRIRNSNEFIDPVTGRITRNPVDCTSCHCPEFLTGQVDVLGTPVPERDALAGGTALIVSGTGLGAASLVAAACALSGPPGWAVGAVLAASAGACLAGDQIGSGIGQVSTGVPVGTRLNQDVLQEGCGLSPTMADMAEFGINTAVSTALPLASAKCSAPRATPGTSGATSSKGLYNRCSFRRDTIAKAVAEAPRDATGQMQCPTCSDPIPDEIVVNSPNGPICRRSFDLDHYPTKWADRVADFKCQPNPPTRAEVIDAYNCDVRVQCPSCNHSHRFEIGRGG